MISTTTTRERPMNVSAWEVRAIRDGRKTQTRRVVKSQPLFDDLKPYWTAASTDRKSVGKWKWGRRDHIGSIVTVGDIFPCPFGQPGDLMRTLSRQPESLRIKSVRIERVQDISEADAISEGFPGSFSPAFFDGWEMVGPDGEMPSQEFAKQFDIDNGPNSWDANPWVWVIEHERITK